MSANVERTIACADRGARGAAVVRDGGATVSAQRGRRRRAPAAPQTPQASAPIDLTGYWVSIVNEDWRWRMVTPPKGDYASVPISPEGRKVADTWDASKDGSCLAFGAAGLMRDADAAAHHLGKREHAEDRHRQRSADAAARVRQVGRATGDEIAAGFLGR